ncbi:MAG: potassium-transporting ATPase subunit KdpC [Bacteroidales bacterium]
MKTLLISIKAFLFFTVLTGFVYPLMVTGIAQFAFPAKANGSLLIKDNKIIGSALIGQQFNTDRYFTPRPSVVSYNPLPSGGSNFGLTNAKLKQQIDQRKEQFTRFNQLDSNAVIPAEMLFASASGLDPHISKQAALLQVNRIVKARRFNTVEQQQLIACINRLTESPQMLVLGQERVNVLLLNLELDKIR